MKKINGNIVSTLMCSFINFKIFGGASVYSILLMDLNPSKVSQPLLGHQLPSELDFLNSPSFQCRCCKIFRNLNMILILGCMMLQ